MGPFSVETSEINSWITAPRFATYLAAADGDQDRAFLLYCWNAQLAAAVFEVVHHVEVLIRNAMHREIAADHPEGALRSWLVDPKVLDQRELENVEATIERILREKHVPTENRVVGGLSFGFWTQMVGKRYDDLWVATLHRAFSNGSGLRKDTAAPLNRLTGLRNRAAHHESLLNVPITDRLDDLYGVASDVEERAAEFVRALSRVEAVLSVRP